MERVPRELFVPPDAQAWAYSDQALPIDCGQTISQPYIVALMTESAQLTGAERVLEIGTGCGYQTAILAELAMEVFTVERHEPLAREAQQRLGACGYTNVHFRIGDGSRGWAEHAPFDRILLTAAARQCPPALWDQLADEGILVGPFGSPDQQFLQARRKIDAQCFTTTLTACRFVPLIADSPPASET